MKNLRQRGELALTLSLLGIFISLIGIGIGTSMSRSVQQSTSQAQTGDYPYRSILEIRDENNQLIKWMPGLIWATTYEEKIAGRNNGDIKDSDGNASLKWEPKSVPLELQDTMAQISIGLPAGYRVVSSFCTSVPTSICANMKVEPDSLTYSRISVEKNGYISYGIRITSGTAPTTAPTTVPTTQPTGTPAPTALPTTTQIPTPTATPTPTPTITRIPYRLDSTLAIRDELSTQIIPYEPDMKYVLTVDGSQKKYPGNLKTGDLAMIQVLTQDLDPIYRDASINIELTDIPAGYEVTNFYCIDNRLDVCRSVRISSDKKAAFSIKIKENADFDYGWYVKKITPTPTVTALPTPNSCELKVEECKPTNIIMRPNMDSVNVSWDKPTCTGYKQGDSFWIDVISNRQSSSETDSIVCVAETTATYATCHLGSDLKGRILNKNSTEYKTETWQNNHDYTVQVFTVQPVNSCISEAQSGTFIYDISEPDKTPDPDDCKYLGGNPNATERVVFLPVGFESIEEFEQLVTSQVNAIDKTNINRYKGRFNYSMYKHIAGDGAYGCKKDGEDDQSCMMNSPDALAAINKCNGNISVIVAQWSWKIHYGYASFGGRSVVMVDNPWFQQGGTLIHEFGHTLFDLADEYVYEEKNGRSAPGLEFIAMKPNCSKLENEGCKWKDKGSCLKGCTGDSLYRSTENSIMKNQLTGTDHENFNPVSMDVIDAYFTQRATFQVASSVQPEYKNAIYVHLIQPSEGKLELKSVETKQSYPDSVIRKPGTFKDGAYTLQVMDSQGNPLWETQLSAYSDTTHDDKGPELTTDYYEYLPYFKTASSILISDAQGKTVLMINLQEQNIAPPIPAGNLCGNSVCDAGNGETANSCRVDCGEHLVKSELERSDLDFNKQVNTQDMAILIDEEVYGKSDKGDIDGDSKTNALDYSLLIKWLGRDY